MLNEDLLQILEKFGDSIGEPIEVGDVEVVLHVQATFYSDSNIIVLFLRRFKRDAVHNKARKNRLSPADLGGSSSR